MRIFKGVTGIALGVLRVVLITEGVTPVLRLSSKQFIVPIQDIVLIELNNYIRVLFN